MEFRLGSLLAAGVMTLAITAAPAAAAGISSPVDQPIVSSVLTPAQTGTTDPTQLGFPPILPCFGPLGAPGTGAVLFNQGTFGTACPGLNSGFNSFGGFGGIGGFNAGLGFGGFGLFGPNVNLGLNNVVVNGNGIGNGIGLNGLGQFNNLGFGFGNSLFGGNNLFGFGSGFGTGIGNGGNVNIAGLNCTNQGSFTICQ